MRGSGLQVEAEAAQGWRLWLCGRAWTRAERHRARAVPLLEVCEPESHVRSEASVGEDTTVLLGEVRSAVERIAVRTVARGDLRCGVSAIGMAAQRGAAA